MRVAIDTTTVAARKVTISGVFAQLDARNAEKDELLFQWRYITKDDAANAPRESAWFDFGSCETRYTSADASPDLSGTVSNVTAEAKLRTPEGQKLSAGARVEVRVLNRRGKEQKEAPLGFRDVRVTAESAPQAVFFVIR